MQILKQEYPVIVLLPETLTDLWYLEKIIDPGDFVSSSSFRKFQTETGKSERKRVWIKVQVEKTDFQKFSNVLRVLGKIVEGRPEELISLGAHHTLELSPGNSFTLEKTRWLDYHKRMLSRAVSASKRPKQVIVVMDEDQATVFSLTEIGLEEVSTVSCQGRGKWSDVDDSIRQKYFHELAKTISSFDVPHIIVGGPGFAKSDFRSFCVENYPELAKKIITVDLGSTGKTGVNELLSRNEISKALEEARLSRETRLINELMAEIGKGNLATYGIDQVKEALDYGAVDKLLITDKFFSENREICEGLLQKAEETRSEIEIIGADYDPGKQLQSLGGIAAILRFKI